MITKNQRKQYTLYNEARKFCINNPHILIALEEYLTTKINNIVSDSIESIKNDYNEASFLYPFWKNYPPDDRGNQPIKDQYPWLEVGEHAVGVKLARLIGNFFTVHDTGFPTGADQRFVVENEEISKILAQRTKAAWLFIDIKSVGPRDDHPHTVMSHNQISGDGSWEQLHEGMQNSVLKAIGPRAEHDFYASLPPLVVLSNGTFAPLVTIALKPVYQMLPANDPGTRNNGQPLSRIDIACIPNRLLLTRSPNYLKQYPCLLFPGKDDKSKNPLKLRARVSFDLLKKIAPWRVQSISVSFP